MHANNGNICALADRVNDASASVQKGLMMHLQVCRQGLMMHLQVYRQG